MSVVSAPLVSFWRVRLPGRPGALLRKYAALFAVMVSGGIAGSGLIGVYSAYEDNRAALTRMQMQDASAAAAQIEQFFDETVRVIASVPPSAVVSRDLTSRRDEYLRLLRLAPAITGLTYIDGNGREQVRMSRLGLTLTGSGIDSSADPAFVGTRAGGAYISVPYFRDASEPYVTIAYPEKTPNGGVTVAEVNLKFIWDVISRIEVGHAGKAYVVDRNGTLIADPSISLVLRKTDLSGFEPVRAALSGADQQAALLATDLQGRPIITTSQAIRSVGWWVFVEQPFEDAFAGLFSSLARTALLLLGGLSIGVVASVVVARRVVKPIQAMQATRAQTEQELRIARDIQQALLPRQLPLLPGWRVRAHYQPARAVGGDFYDVVPLPDGRLGLVIGDVSGEGIPAALTMATARTIVRSVASTTSAPGEVLARTNELLCQDVPHGMFATCLYAILDPQSGHVRFGNAGHGAPFQRHAVDGSVTELRACGMPLGLMPGMTYLESEAVLAPGDLVVAYSDGLSEAHSPRREMFGVPRVVKLVNTAGRTGTQLVDHIVGALKVFTGPNWEQEDDLTVVVLERNSTGGWRTLDQFEVASQPGNERVAMHRVVEAIAGVSLPAASRERLKTAVAEAVMNAMDHGNRYQADVPVTLRVAVSDTVLSVRVTDRGGRTPSATPEHPDLNEKLAGRQGPHGWGLFLIRAMVDEVQTSIDHDQHTIDLRLRLNKPTGALEP